MFLILTTNLSLLMTTMIDTVKVVKEDPIKCSRQRVVKNTFSHLVKICNVTLKKLFIDTVQHMDIKNTEIAVRCGM